VKRILSRRSGLSTAISLTLIVTLCIIAACADDATSTPTGEPQATTTSQPTSMPTPSPTATVARVPVSPRLEVAMVTPGNQVTMYHLTFFSAGGVLRPMYNFLIWNDIKTDEEKPMLATEWSSSPDAKSWTFNLRRGVPFHDGTEFTSKDVRRSWEIITSEKSIATGASDFRGSVGSADNIDISDPNKVTFNLIQPSPEFSFAVSEAYTLAIYSADHWDRVGEEGYQANPIGTGPFKFTELSVNEHILYERFKQQGEDHWWKIPEFDELQFHYVNEEATRLAMLLAKEIHIADISRTLLPEAQSRGFKVANASLPGLDFRGVIGGQYFDKPMEIKEGPNKGEIHPVAPTFDPQDPFRDARVRKALNLAIDREQIKETYFGDAGILEAVQGIPPYRFDHKSDWKPYPYDPEEAKRLLVEAGYPNGFEFNFPVGPWTGLSEAPDIAEVLVGYWKAIGLNPKLIPEETSVTIPKARARELGRTITFWQGSINTYQQHMLFLVSKVTGAPGYVWEYEELDDMYIQLTKATDPQERLRITHQMGDFVYSNYLSLPMFFIVPQIAFDPGILKDYSVNYRNFGPVNHHEFTEPVYR
jgi:peptide/nickel transport system substrate-binding protein